MLGFLGEGSCSKCVSQTHGKWTKLEKQDAPEIPFGQLPRRPFLQIKTCVALDKVAGSSTAYNCDRGLTPRRFRTPKHSDNQGKEAYACDAHHESIDPLLAPRAGSVFVFLMGLFLQGDSVFNAQALRCFVRWIVGHK